MKDYDLEEAARMFRDDFLDKNDNDVSKYDIEDIFIAGAEWKREQFEKGNRIYFNPHTAQYSHERTTKDDIEYIAKEAVERK